MFDLFHNHPRPALVCQLRKNWQNMGKWAVDQHSAQWFAFLCSSKKILDFLKFLDCMWVFSACQDFPLSAPVLAINLKQAPFEGSWVVLDTFLKKWTHFDLCHLIKQCIFKSLEYSFNWFLSNFFCSCSSPQRKEMRLIQLVSSDHEPTNGSQELHYICSLLLTAYPCDTED